MVPPLQAAALAALLGVSAGRDLIGVYARWVAEELRRLRDKLRSCRGLRGWRRTRRWLDGWLPRWVRRRVGVRPSFKKRAEQPRQQRQPQRGAPAQPGKIRPLLPHMFRGLI
jgi:hypothetical protein